MRAVTFYTNDKYRKLADTLSSSAEAVGVPIAAYSYPEVDKWSAACALKPAVILRAMGEFKDDILYMDADTYFASKPVDLMVGDFDVAWGWYALRHPHGCVLLFKNNPKAVALLKRWTAMFTEYPNILLDETLLGMAYSEMKGTINHKALPPAYTWMKGMGGRFPGAIPVIVHLGEGSGSDKQEVLNSPGSPYSF